MTITPPPRTRSLQGPGRDNEPDPFVALARKISDLRRQIDDATAQVLRMAGLRAEPDLLRVLGSLVVEGGAAFSGDTQIGGNLAVTGTLSLPSGIIDNDVLASPVTIDRTGGAIGNFSIPTIATAVHALNIPVPDGYTRALVMVVASMAAYSLSTSSAGVYLKAAINETTLTNATSSALDPTNGFNWANLSSSASATLTGLSGGDISIRACASSTHALPADPHNVVNLDAMAVFLR